MERQVWNSEDLPSSTNGSEVDQLIELVTGDDDDDEEEEEETPSDDEDDDEGERSIIVEKRVGDVAKSSFHHHLSLKKKACIVKIDNCHYTIVANTPTELKQNDKDRVKGEKSCPTKKATSQRGSEKKKRVDSQTLVSQDTDLETLFKKLKELYTKVNKGQAINVNDLKKTLEFALGVADRTQFLQQSATELAKDNVFESESVPCQVRDWLTMTFTRSSILAKDEVFETSRFKSVATALMAGMSVEKLLKTNLPKSEISKIVLTQISLVDDWTFDIFELNIATMKSMGFRNLARSLFTKFEITSKFRISINCMEAFLSMLEEGYRKYNNPYHNDLHAADVTQTTNCIISQTDLKSYMTDLEIFSIIFAALIHDFEHTGTTNTFHINARTDLALLYNDRAVLENFHVSQVFKRMRDDNNVNMLANLNQAEYIEFRYSVVDIVLATDMSYHFQQLKLLKHSITSPDMNITMLQLVCMVVHLADISHPMKPWHIHEKWTKRLFEEFFIQGDREAELGLPISPLCDRHNTMLAESQIGFIDYIISPTLNQIFEAIPYSMNIRIEEMGNEFKKPSQPQIQESISKFKEEIENSMQKNKMKWSEETNK